MKHFQNPLFKNFLPCLIDQIEAFYSLYGKRKKKVILKQNEAVKLFMGIKYRTLAIIRRTYIKI